MSRQSHTHLTLFSVKVNTRYSDDHGLTRFRRLDIELPFGEISIPLEKPAKLTPAGIYSWFRWQSSTSWYPPDLDDGEGMRDQYKRRRKG